MSQTLYADRCRKPAVAPVLAVVLAARAVAAVAAMTLATGSLACAAKDPAKLYAETFDTHWERLRDDYPYFELYGVDWEQERADHRPRAIAAENADEFAWELARMLAALPDPHLSFIPSIDTMKGRWAIPELKTAMIGKRPYFLEWPEKGKAGAYPEIVEVEGFPATGTAEILAAGPLGTTFEVRLRWADGSESDHPLQRPDTSNIPPPDKHYGTGWLVTGRVGGVGYMKIRLPIRTRKSPSSTSSPSPPNRISSPPFPLMASSPAPPERKSSPWYCPGTTDSPFESVPEKSPFS